MRENRYRSRIKRNVVLKYFSGGGIFLPIQRADSICEILPPLEQDSSFQKSHTYRTCDKEYKQPKRIVLVGSTAEKQKLIRDGIQLLLLITSLTLWTTAAQSYMDRKSPTDFPDDAKTRHVLKCVKNKMILWHKNLKKAITR